MEKDIVLDLKEKSFGLRNIAEKLEIIKSGRPTPLLKTKVGTRSFQTRWYEQIDWLCASAIQEKLYCWPCLLFQPKSGQSWTDGGYSNYKHILSDGKLHSKSMSHLNNYKCLKTFGVCDIMAVIGESAEVEKKRHNKLVEENRLYLKQLVNAVIYLCKQELPLCGHNEGKDSLNKGNYRELLNCFADIDSVFASRLYIKEESNQFSGVSSTTQNDIISAVDNVLANVIRTEVENAPFISVQADLTTDCATHAQLSIIVRYLTECKIQERFLGFYDVNSDKSASRLADVIENALDSFTNAKTKLVCHTYDGAAVMVGERNGVETKLKKKGFKYGDFIHCYAHKLDSVLSRSAEKVNGVKIFFSHLRSFSKFPFSSSKRKNIFREFRINILFLSDSKFCNRSRTVLAIKDSREKLKSVFQNILDHDENWDEDTVAEADNLLEKLDEFNFMFFVNCFYRILPQAEKLSDILQRKDIDIKYAQDIINGFIQYIENQCNDELLHNIVQETMAEIERIDDTVHSPRKRKRGKQMNYIQTYVEIFQSTLASLKERFAHIEEFLYFELLDVKKFEVFAHTFPNQHVDDLQNKYPDMFDYRSLINELKYLYRDKDFKKCETSLAILELFYKLDFLSAMPETVKLIQLFLTIPSTPVASDRSFSTLQRIRSFLRGTMTQECLSSLARISIEKQILVDLERQKTLHDKILEEFAIKPRRLEFMFK